MHGRSPFKSNKSNNASDPIAVIIGKTFETTTLPDGSQQIIEVTKYKRLNDGHIYTESKLRNQATEDDKENVARTNIQGGLYGGGHKSKAPNKNCGFKLSLANQLACPSSLTLTSSSGSFSSDNDNSNRQAIIPHCGDSYDSENSNSQKGIINCMTKETAQMSVVTEDYEEDSMVEEYLYENEERKSLSPYAAARKENYLGGWCPSFDDLENKSLQLQQQSSVWSTWANDSVFGDNVLMQMFDRSNNNGNHGRSLGESCDQEEEHDRFHLKSSMATTCKSRMGARKCKVLLCFVAFVAVAAAVVAVAFRPSSEEGWNISKEAHADSNCIHLEIVIDTDANTVGKDNPDGDVNEWSLVRHGKNDHLISIAKSSELSPDTVHNFQHCVQPGVFTFTISDSGGDGLGAEGEGGYYIVADGVKLGVSPFFFHNDEMTFTLPFKGDEYDGDGETECADDFFLVVKTDNNPGETAWDVVDNQSGKTVMEGGPYELPWTVYTKRTCLKDGNYTFNMRDGGKNGVCCDDGYGFYMLYVDDDLVMNSDGKYSSGASTVFLLGGKLTESESV
jgi:hypothetical protein